MKTNFFKLLFLTFLFVCPGLRAENQAVTKMLKERYDNAYTQNFGDNAKLKGEYYIVVFYNNGKTRFGVCDIQGNELFEAKYDKATYTYDYWMMTDGDKVYIYTPDRKLVHTVDGYTEVLSYDPVNRLIVVRKDPKTSSTGVIDFDGNVVVAPEYDYIDNATIQKASYKDPWPMILLYRTVDKKYKYGLADFKGKIIYQPIYDDIKVERWSGQSEVVLKLGNKEGRADLQGNELIPADKYERISFPMGDRKYRTVTRDGLTSVIDADGKELIPFVPGDINIDDVIKNYEYIKVNKDGKTGYVSRSGKVVLPLEYDGILCPIIDGKQYCFTASKGKNVGAFSLDGSVLVPMQYHIIQPWGEGGRFYGGFLVGVNYSANIPQGILNIWKVPEGTLWGYYDEKGKEILKPEFAYVGVYEGLILVNRGGVCGSLTSFLSPNDVKGGLWGYYDMDGNEIIPLEYEALSAFTNGVANGVKDGVASVIPHPKKGTKLKILNGGSSAFNSPVDKDIPENGKKDNEMFAFIFATENYNEYEGADYALRDGETLKQYCEKTLGAPEKNVRLFADATYGNIKSNLKKVAEIADVYDGDAKFIIYFSGLGTTDDATGNPYLLGADAVPGAIGQTAIDLSALTAELEQIPSRWILVVVDAPLNGMDRLGKPLGEGRGVHLKAKQPEPKGPVFVVTAASEGQNAGVDATTGHGLLTLAILEDLRENPAPKSIQERLDAVTAKVKRKSVEAGTDVQAPSVKTGSHPTVTTAKY